MTTLSTNKLRTILTGFAVGWGVLILVILLSSGMGLSNGIRANVAQSGLNDTSVDITLGSISKPYNGLPRWYTPRYTSEDVELIRRLNSDVISFVAPYRESWGGTMMAGERSADGRLMGITSALERVRRVELLTPTSRFINARDELECRKVVVLNSAIATNLFGSPDLAIGKTVTIKKTALTVVGVYKSSNGSWGANYIPLRTMQTLGLYSDGLPAACISGIYALCPDLHTEEQENALRDRIVAQMAARKGFDPTDTDAVWTRSQATNLTMANKIYAGIDFFLWVIGLSTLAIGVVGVINIMQIAVTERKREIGIRKAIGAKPRDLIVMILAEAVVITLISGLIGLVVGVGIMAGIDAVMAQAGIGTQTIGESTSSLFLSPVIDLPTSIAIVLTMVVSGLVAGYLPARKAVRVPTIEAMRH